MSTSDSAQKKHGNVYTESSGSAEGSSWHISSYPDGTFPYASCIMKEGGSLDFPQLIECHFKVHFPCCLIASN